MVKALFLDRDGTINVDYGYVFQKEKFKFIDGVIELCRRAEEKGYLIIVITNQSGIARGYYSDADFQEITRYMTMKFADSGVHITDVFYCPDLDGNRRKPNAGMFLEARDKYDIDMQNSISVGDKPRDIEAGKRQASARTFYLKRILTKLWRLYDYCNRRSRLYRLICRS